MSQKIKLAIYQMNSTVGDLTGNTDKINSSKLILLKRMVWTCSLLLSWQLVVIRQRIYYSVVIFYLRSQRELDRLL